MTINCEIEKCLFNSKDNVVEEIIKLLSTAKSSIYVMHFWFSWKPIADALIDAHNRGVKVNLLTDQRSIVKYMQDDQQTYSQSVPEYLNDNGIKRIRIYLNDHLMHHKAIIADDIVTIGSLNLYEQSIYENNENVISIKSLEVSEFYKTEFESIFENCLTFSNALETTKNIPRN